MMGRPKPENQQVVCRCNGTVGSGLYKIDGRHLMLESDFGTHRVLIGLQEHRRLAKKLLKNICTSAALKASKTQQKTKVESTIPAALKPLVLELAAGPAASLEDTKADGASGVRAKPASSGR